MAASAISRLERPLMRLIRRPASPRAALLAVACILILLGGWLTAREAIFRARARGLGGDFAAAMFDIPWWDGSKLVYGWWDGSGIAYGPIFVIERWMVNMWPAVFTLETFWLMNFIWLAVAFLCCVAASRSSPLIALLVLGLWLSSRQLRYSLAVVANPEILELMLLSIAWLASSHRSAIIPWLSVTLATLTKVIPAIFAPMLLILHPSARAIFLAGSVAILITVVVGLGQGMPLQDALVFVFLPFLYRAPGGDALIGHIRPIPSSTEHLGLSSAIARLLGMTEGDPNLADIQAFSNFVVAVALLSAIVVVAVLIRSRRLDPLTSIALAYCLFFALIPIVTPSAHPHTFVFLLPAWVALAAILSRDSDVRARIAFGAFVLAVYLMVSVPGVLQLDSPAFQDPIWANLALFGGVLAYSSRRLMLRA